MKKTTDRLFFLYIITCVFSCLCTFNASAMEQNSACSKAAALVILNSRISNACQTKENYTHLLEADIDFFPGAMRERYSYLHAHYEELISAIQTKIILISELIHKWFQPQMTDQLVDSHLKELCILIYMLEDLCNEFTQFVNFNEQRIKDEELALAEQKKELQNYAQNTMQESNFLTTTTSENDNFNKNTTQTIKCIRNYMNNYVPRKNNLVFYSMPDNPDYIPPQGFSRELMFPSSLRSLKNVELLYYPSRQKNVKTLNTCATQAIANALCIHKALASNSLDATTVYRNAGIDRGLHTIKGTLDFESTRIAKACDLSNLHIIEYIDEWKNPFFIKYSTDFSDLELGHLIIQNKDKFCDLFCEDIANSATEKIFSKIKSEEEITAFFVCSADIFTPNDHAVLIAIVKQKKCVPKIIYIDSNNFQIQEYSKNAAFIWYLYLHLLA